MNSSIPNLFDISGRVAVITGGAGLLGQQHAEAILRGGGIPALVDIESAEPEKKAQALAARHGREAVGYVCDITKLESVEKLRKQILARFERVEILINNAANNPKMESGGSIVFSRVENFPLEVWNADLAVGLTGAFLCSRVFGMEMARKKQGVILNVASDLALIAPDQRLYRKDGLPEEQQPVKPVTYSVVKSGLIGLTRYFAGYWASQGVRVNAISPGGVYASQPAEFVQRLASLIPLGRMANLTEYQGAILFLCSDASSYMTGANLVIDGGRTCL